MFKLFIMDIGALGMLTVATPYDHIKGVNLPPLGIIQRPIAHNCNRPHSLLPEGLAQRVPLHFRVSKRALHCGIHPGHNPQRLLEAPAQAVSNVMRARWV